MAYGLNTLASLTTLIWLVLMTLSIKGYFSPNYQPYLISGNHHFIESVVLLLIFVATFGLYIKCVKERLGSNNPQAILAWTAVFTLILVFLYPFACQDVYYYMAIGKLQSHYQVNPYITAARQIASWRLDPFLSNSDWGFLTHVYGPVWAKLTGWIVMLAGNNSIQAMVFFKLWAGIIHFINTLLVGLIAKKNKLDSGAAMLIYGWNPLLLFELPGHAHNDAVVLTFIILALYFLSSKLSILSIPFLTMAVLTKYIPAILVPFFMAWHLLHHKLRELLGGGILALLLIWLCFAPYWTGWQIFDGLLKQMNFYSIKSLHAVFYQGISLLLPQFPEKLVFQITSVMLTVIFVAIYIYVLRNYWQAPNHSYHLLISSSIVVIVIYLLIANKWFQPWYLAWIVPLVAIDKLPLFMTCTALFLTFSAELSRIPQLLAGNVSLPVQLWTIFIAWLPLLIFFPYFCRWGEGISHQ